MLHRIWIYVVAAFCLIACAKNTTDTPEGGLPVLSPQVTAQIPSVSLSTKAQQYNRAAGGFAFRLLQTLYDGESMVASPLSLQMAFSMAAAGAEGQTLKEMLEVMGFGELGKEGMNEYSKSLLEQLPAVDTSVRVQLADALIVNQDVRVNQAYKNILASCYYAPAQSLDFNQVENVKKVVNDWCKANTHGLIPSILDRVDPADLSYLLNALYFKAAWTQETEESQIVKDQVFRKKNGTAPVTYLTDLGSFPYADKSTYHAASRSLGKNHQYTFTIFLPKKDDGLEPMLRELAQTDVPALLAQMDARDAYLDLKIPLFESSGNYDNLVQVLQEMGVKDAFGEDARFQMFEDPQTGKPVSCYIGEIIQKARISLNEGGIEAAAATLIRTRKGAALGEETPDPVLFYADHPSAYAITERSSGTILFAGVFDGVQN